MNEEEQIRRPVVLSVDDDVNAHFFIRRSFDACCDNVRMVNLHDGEEVIQYLSRQGRFSDEHAFPQPDLLLLDLKMPVVSGIGVLEWLRDHPEIPRCPTVILSSSDQPEEVERAYGLGCACYVIKPQNLKKLDELALALAVEHLGRINPAEIPVAPLSTFAVPRAGDLPPAGKSGDAAEPPAALAPESPEMFKLLIEQVKDYAIFLVDLEGHVRSWNQGARRIHGYEPAEIIGKHFSGFYPRVDTENGKPGFELRMAEEMGRYEEEGWRLRKDGSKFWANVTITPLRDDGGRLTGYAKVTRDLTQRKLQEGHLQSLLESEERFRLLVEQIRDYAIFFLDAKGYISSWNQGARRIKGYTSDEIIGKHFSIFYPPEDVARGHPEQELTLAIRDGRYDEEGWRVGKDGVRFWASVVITSLWDKRGNLTGFAKITRDLTQRREEDLALRHKAEDLESFAHSLSHDLRAPVRAVTGFVDILQNDADLSADERRDLLGRIAKSAHSMESLINGMLKLSQISQLSLAPEERVGLNDVLLECVAVLGNEISVTHAEVTIAEGMPLVRTNPTLLLQIFANLLGNALRFARPGVAPHIEVFARQVDTECEVHVRDNGVGIPPQFQESIFNLFERGDAQGGGGFGIGLAIVKKAVDRIGGRIAVTSQEGEGSEFVVTMPCEVAEPAPRGEPVEKCESCAPPENLGSQLTGSTRPPSNQ